MIYANGDVYEGNWQADLKHGYGILEKKNQDKYYGYWNKGLKEGQGYYYYSSTGKIYLGEWHEDAPRCGIFTDVDDENLKKFDKNDVDAPSLIPSLMLMNPNNILENSISDIYFLRSIKMAKIKNVNELFGYDFIQELTNLFSVTNQLLIEQEEGKLPENKITIDEFKKICNDNLNVVVKGKIKLTKMRYSI